MAPIRVLVVDDEPGIRFALRQFLATRGFLVDEADSCAAAEASLRRSRPDIAIVDYCLPDATGLDLLGRIRAFDPALPVLLLTAHATIDIAVKAIKLGAENFLTKPFDLPSLAHVLERTIEERRGRHRLIADERREARRRVDPFRGRSPAVARLAREADHVLGSESPVLILGETGTGKGVLARWIHDHGSRRDEAFIDLNCASLSREFLESELFGHEKGAFTGATAAKAGLLDVAHRGTLFLDEIGDLPPEVQPKLLKVLEEKRYRRLGDVRDRTTDVRLVAATNRDPSGLARTGTFRPDLYYRISTLPLHLPPLRERTEDIEPLAEELLERLAEDMGRPARTLDASAVEALTRYAWPGNVRELRNVLERSILVSENDRISAADLRLVAAEDATPLPTTDLSLTLEEVERRHIGAVLDACGGNVDEAGRRLGIPRSTLYAKLERLGLSGRRIRERKSGPGN